MAAFFNDPLRGNLACKGSCHGNPGLGERAILGERQTNALINATLSSGGAALAGFGCATSGTTCGLTVILSADAARQFSVATTNTDPIVRIAVDLGATERQAVNIALAADFVTGAFSIKGAYNGLLLRSLPQASAGTLGTTSVDIISTMNTIEQLNRSVESSQQ